MRMRRIEMNLRTPRMRMRRIEMNLRMRNVQLRLQRMRDSGSSRA